MSLAYSSQRTKAKFHNSRVAEHFSSDEVKEILTRAESIRSSNPNATHIDEKALIQSALEAGYDQIAIEQAIRERLAVKNPVVVGGQTVFAISGDGYAYPAIVKSVAEGTCAVEFLAGGTATITTDQVSPMTLSPGTKIDCPWEGFGWWASTIVSADLKEEWVRVSDGWGSEETFPLEKVRLPKRRTKQEAANPVENLRFKLVLAATSGGLVGAALMWALQRFA